MASIRPKCSVWRKSTAFDARREAGGKDYRRGDRRGSASVGREAAGMVAALRNCAVKSGSRQVKIVVISAKASCAEKSSEPFPVGNGLAFGTDSWHCRRSPVRYPHPSNANRRVAGDPDRDTVLT